MAHVDLRPFDAADYVDTPEKVVLYLEDALTDPDPAEFLHALGVVARSKGMSEIARTTGLSQPTLDRALADGHPEFGTVVAVLKCLGLRLGVQLVA